MALSRAPRGLSHSQGIDCKPESCCPRVVIRFLSIHYTHVHHLLVLNLYVTTRHFHSFSLSPCVRCLTNAFAG